MEIIMISETKLKIMLSAEDLKEFELEAESLDYSNTETKRMFWDVLSRAKHSVGFDTDGHRVLVQLYPSREGGCEMFITRLGLLCREEGRAEEEEYPPTVIASGKGHSRARGNSELKTAFVFNTMEGLLAVCRRLAAIAYDGDSEAFVGDDRRYYLFLSELESSSYLPLDEYAFIGEYGTQENALSLRHLISEHAKTICDKEAVACLAQF